MTGVEIVLLVLAGLLLIAAIGKVLDMHRGGTEVPDPDPCVMRPQHPHVCLRPDHEQRHARPTPKETA